MTTINVPWCSFLCHLTYLWFCRIIWYQLNPADFNLRTIFISVDNSSGRYGAGRKPDIRGRRVVSLLCHLTYLWFCRNIWYQLNPADSIWEQFSYLWTTLADGTVPDENRTSGSFLLCHLTYFGSAGLSGTTSSIRPISIWEQFSYLTLADGTVPDENRTSGGRKRSHKRRTLSSSYRRQSLMFEESVHF